MLGMGKNRASSPNPVTLCKKKKKKAETKINKTPQFGGKSVQSHTKTIDEPDKEKTNPKSVPYG